MKIRSLTLLAATLLATAVAHADYAFKESFSKSSAFEPNGTVNLSNVNGSVTIETWDKNEILVEGEKRAKTEEELKLIDLKLDLSSSHAGIKVHLPKRPGGWFGGGSIRASVSFHLKVPASATLEGINSVNGSVTIKGVRGGVRAETVNGRIRAEEVGGRARLHTVNGSVEATFAQVGASDDIEAKTVNGSVKLSLPSETGAKIRASVVNGHISCDFPIKLNGSVSKRSLSGTIGDGGASLEAESVNGRVRISKS